MNERWLQAVARREAAKAQWDAALQRVADARQEAEIAEDEWVWCVRAVIQLRERDNEVKP